MAKVWLISGTLFGLLSVVLGAFGAHSLRDFLDEYGKSIYEKAVLYQMFHALGLIALGLLQLLCKHTSFSVAGWGLFIGVLLFSGSLYLLAMTGVKWFGAITPIGGVAFLFGWATLALALFKLRIRS
jgi:uncharacterized membrane protein YgdD (TMEM256/DUF423 family)